MTQEEKAIYEAIEEVRDNYPKDIFPDPVDENDKDSRKVAKMARLTCDNIREAFERKLRGGEDDDARTCEGCERSIEGDAGAFMDGGDCWVCSECGSQFLQDHVKQLRHGAVKLADLIAKDDSIPTHLQADILGSALECVEAGDYPEQGLEMAKSNLMNTDHE